MDKPARTAGLLVAARARCLAGCADLFCRTIAALQAESAEEELAVCATPAAASSPALERSSSALVAVAAPIIPAAKPMPTLRALPAPLKSVLLRPARIAFTTPLRFTLPYVTVSELAARALRERRCWKERVLCSLIICSSSGSQLAQRLALLLPACANLALL